ncbi:Polycomb group protein EMBRYONIC FLOWER 2 [Dichanthelium oligosanthes]|uniref:Polycomb group protein EMBRYONIC FLOWER 2 n=1 Tax=Dichanthelium oligosanthes TaxID=888268 RepID=A0A1E5VYK8_9POAL|nr:Polycomb group protein EMBRYONIC FLOWER 2 [Dichanthelium oligosanthes]
MPWDHGRGCRSKEATAGLPCIQVVAMAQTRSRSMLRWAVLHRLGSHHADWPWSEARTLARIQITISLSGNSNPEVRAQNIFPLYALFAKPISAVLHEGPKFLKQESYMTFCSHKINAVCPYQLQVNICAQEAGARDMLKSPYNYYLYNDVPASSLQHIIREKSVRVTPVTEDFCCSFCLVKCGSFMVKVCNITYSHRMTYSTLSSGFISQREQGVNVSLKPNTWTNEDFPAGVDPRQRTFSYFSKHKKHRRLVTATEAIVPSEVTEVIIPSKATDTSLLSKATEMIVPTTAIEMIVPSKETETIVLTQATETIRHGHLLGTSVSDTTVDPAYSLHGGHLSPPRVLQFGKTRRLSVDQFDPRNRQLLQKRQFFHSHKGQPMEFEEVLSDHDSEDEVDDDVADFEDRRMLDDFINVMKDEKCIMHMWNSFVSRQRSDPSLIFPFNFWLSRFRMDFPYFAQDIGMNC